MRVVWARFGMSLSDSGLARQLLADEAAIGFPGEPTAFGMHIRAGMAELCARLGERQYAEALYEQLLPDAPFNWDCGNPHYSEGSAWRPMGMLAALMGRYDDAARHFEDALAVEAAMPHRPALAKTRAEYATLLVQRNEPGDRLHARVCQRLAADDIPRTREHAQRRHESTLHAGTTRTRSGETPGSCGPSQRTPASRSARVPPAS